MAIPYLAAFPVGVRERIAEWESAGELDDELGAIWRRRKTSEGPGFGRDLYDLREDPDVLWVAAWFVLTEPNPALAGLTARAFFARFGLDLVEPLEHLGLRAEVDARPRVARLLRVAAGDRGTPARLAARLGALATRLDMPARAREEADVALEALQRGAVGEALAAALKLWRAARQPELVRVIDVLTGPAASPPAASLAAGRDAIEAAIGRTPLQPDPRLARWLAPLATGLQGAPPGPLLRAALVESLPATRALVDALGIDAPDPPITPLPVEQLEPLLTAVALWADRRFAPLWDEVYAHPGDLGPRWVLADLYTERGDPRGPFMAASLHAGRALARPRGEATRLRSHERAWLGAFGAFAHPPRLWRDGVLIGLRTHSVGPWALRHREWRLVEELHITSELREVLLPIEHFPRLRALGVLLPEQLAGLAAQPVARQLERVYVRWGPWIREAAVAAIQAWPDPAALILVDPEASEAELRDRLVGQGLPDVAWAVHTPAGALWPTIATRPRPAGAELVT